MGGMLPATIPSFVPPSSLGVTAPPPSAYMIPSSDDALTAFQRYLAAKNHDRGHRDHNHHRSRYRRSRSRSPPPYYKEPRYHRSPPRSYRSSRRSPGRYHSPPPRVERRAPPPPPPRSSRGPRTPPRSP